MATLKILVVGDVLGHYDDLYAKVSGALQKHAFSALFCVGGFFPSKTETDTFQAYLEGSKTAPIPTYILGFSPDDARYLRGMGKGGHICHNIAYLGQSGVFQFQGLNIAYVSGIYNPHRYHNALSGKDSEGKFQNFYTPDIISNLMAEVNKSGDIDILLSCEWARGFGNLLNHYEIPKGPKSKDVNLIGSPVLAAILRDIRPRYHICGKEDIYYERIPYQNMERPESLPNIRSNGKHLCRKICMARVNNTRGQKFIYALNIAPIPKMTDEELYTLPERYTECPYETYELELKNSTEEAPIAELPQEPEPPKKRDRDGSAVQLTTEPLADAYAGLPLEFGSNKIKKKPPPEKQFNFPQHKPEPKAPVKQPVQQNKESRGKGNKPPTDPRALHCWFCLSSPQVEKHLIVSVGDEIYIALAKGGMDAKHCLLIPLIHTEDYHELSMSAREELFKYKTALRSFFDSIGQDVVFFERFIEMKGNNHMHTQVVPIPKELSKHCREAFEAEGRAASMSFEEVPREVSILDITRTGEQYFYVELPDQTKLYHRIRGRHSFQFGRQAIARLLGRPELVDWKSCQLPPDQESQIASDFKSAFQPYDFS